MVFWMLKGSRNGLYYLCILYIFQNFCRLYHRPGSPPLYQPCATYSSVDQLSVVVYCVTLCCKNISSNVCYCLVVHRFLLSDRITLSWTWNKGGVWEIRDCVARKGHSWRPSAINTHSNCCKFIYGFILHRFWDTSISLPKLRIHIPEHRSGRKFTAGVHCQKN